MSHKKAHNARNADKFIIRFSDDEGRENLRKAAEANMRSMNAQALYYIERGMIQDGLISPAEPTMKKARAKA